MKTLLVNKFRARHLTVVILAAGSCLTNYAMAQQVPSGARIETTSSSNREKASKHAHDGFDLLKAGQNEEAAEQFTMALALIEAPTIRVGRGDALTLLNRWVEAAVDYEAAIAFSLSSKDPPVFAKSQENAKLRLAALQSRLPGLVIETRDTQAQVTIDTKPTKHVLTGEPIFVDPGKHRVVITAFGQSSTHDVEALEATTTTLQAPDAKPDATPATDHHSTRSARSSKPARTEMVRPKLHSDGALDTPTLVSGAATGVLAIGAVVTGVVFWNLRSDYHDSRSEVGAADKRRDVITMAWINTGMTAGAVFAAGLTTYFWLKPSFGDQPASGDTASFEPLPRPSGLVFGTRGSF